jgi:hypothetical protein
MKCLLHKAPYAQKIMMQQALKLRSRNGRKLTTGLRWRNSQKINPASARTKRAANVWLPVEFEEEISFVYAVIVIHQNP